MANPSIKRLKENEVVKVATNVTTGAINKHWKDGRHLEYYVSYRLTGQAAPTAENFLLEAVKMFQDNPEQNTISAAAAIDVYCMASLEDNKAQNGTLIIWV